MKEEAYINKFEELLTKAVKEIKGKDIAIAFSGGVDSAIIAKLLKEIGITAEAYVAGIENCWDFKNAEKAAEEIGLKLNKIILSEKEIEQDLPIQIKILHSLYEKNKILPETPETKLNPVSVSSNFPLFFVEKHAKEEIIISGLGADTLLGGFAKYSNLNRDDAVKQLQKESNALLNFDYLEDFETAKFFNKAIIMPFLNKEVAEFCINLPFEMKIKNGVRKYIIRKLAEKIGLKESSSRPKKSAQYGSGIMKIMKKIAKKHGMKISEYIKFIQEHQL